MEIAWLPNELWIKIMYFLFDNNTNKELLKNFILTRSVNRKWKQISCMYFPLSNTLNEFFEIKRIIKMLRFCKWITPYVSQDQIHFDGICFKLNTSKQIELGAKFAHMFDLHTDKDNLTITREGYIFSKFNLLIGVIVSPRITKERITDEDFPKSLVDFMKKPHINGWKQFWLSA